LQTIEEKFVSEISTDFINSKVISSKEVEESVSENKGISVSNLLFSIDVKED